MWFSDGAHTLLFILQPGNLSGMFKQTPRPDTTILEKKSGVSPWAWASLMAQLVKNPPAMQETWVCPWVEKIRWRRERLPTPVFWPGEFHELYSQSMGLQRARHNWVTFTFTLSLWFSAIRICIYHFEPSMSEEYSRATVPQLSGTSKLFHGRNFFHGPGMGGLGKIQAHDMYCALYFYYYYIRSTSDHQALDPRGWGPPL